MEAFREALDVCGVIDLGFEGYRFTWSNGRSGSGNVQERLDRFVANYRRLNLFEGAQVTHLGSSHFDHCPILLNTGRDNNTMSGEN